MHLALRFWTRLGMWTGILLIVFLGLGMGQGMSALLAHIPAMGGLALVLAASRQPCHSIRLRSTDFAHSARATLSRHSNHYKLRINDFI